MKGRSIDMLGTTEKAVVAIAGTDPTVTAEQLKAGIAALNGRGVGEFDVNPPPRIYTPAQVAKLLAVSERAVRNYRVRGLLKGVYGGPQRARIIGYTAETVRRLVEGSSAGSEA